VIVHFIGAGPGAPDLITVRGLEYIRRAAVVLFAGSLVPLAVIEEAHSDATVVDTAPLALEEIIDEIKKAHAKNLDVARIHSGDPSIYGAIAEQMRRLDDLNIPYDVTPGVPAFAAAAAALKRELTIPEISQTIILTRTSVRSTDMPDSEALNALGQSKATLAIHLSINNLAKVIRELEPYYGQSCPVVVAYRVSWPDEQLIWGTLGTIREDVKRCGITRTALIIVGWSLDAHGFSDSRLYAADHHHVLRPRKGSASH